MPGNWNAVDDLLNIQYVQYVAQMKVVDGIIDHGTNINTPAMPENFKEKDQGRHTFHAIAGAKVVGYDTDREAFLGPSRSYSKPLAVERGKCSGSLAYGDNPCGSLQVKFSLRPGQTLEFAVIVGIGSAEKEGRQAVDEFQNVRKVDESFDELKSFWHKRIEGIAAKTPDQELNATVNTWGIYNCMITYAWSRAASLIYSGIDRDGMDYRDTVQDFLGVMHAIPDEARQRLELMITGQVSTGGGMPVVLPSSHNPGHEIPPKEEDYQSDAGLWLFNAIPAYVEETGDAEFYKKILPYADKGADTVFGHMKRALQFSLERSGAHGLPCGLMADWNDTLRFGRKGESIFTTMQLRFALKVYIDVALFLKKADESSWAKLTLERLDANIKRYAWDGEWFARGFRHDGVKFGSKDSPEGQIFLDTQTWSVISGLASHDQAETAMQQVRKRLFTKYGLALCDPPYAKTDYRIVRASLLNPGLKENGGILVHTQAWAVMAEAILGHGDYAYEYLRAYLPAAYNKKAEVREIEPYVVSQSTHSKESPKHGASRIPWLSSSASWTYYAITRYVLGIRPEINGIRIDPCVPSKWNSFDVVRAFRGKTLIIHFENPKGVEKGVKKTVLNGEVLEGNFVPVTKMKDENEVAVTMG